MRSAILRLSKVVNYCLLVVGVLFVYVLPAQDLDAPLHRYLKRRDGIKYPNVIKVNTLAIPFNNISMTYERGLIPRLSLDISAGYSYGGKQPNVFSINNATIEADMGQIDGFSFTPALRYYVQTCRPNLLEGLYLGIYFRYTNFSTDATFNYYPAGAEVEIYSSDIISDELGGGIMLGYQVMIAERISLDFLFFGPRFSNYHIGYEFNQPVSQQFLDDLSDALNEVINRFGIDYNVELNQTGETYASNTFSFVNMRFGFSIGFAF